jgi:NitT/TauT family transport system substrate-binding protein
MSAYVLSRALTLNGLKISDVKVVRLEVNEHVAAFRRDEVDAAVTLEPVRSELLVSGASLLFDSTAIPGEIVDVLVVRAAYLERNPKAVRELLDGWFRAVDYLTYQPQDAAARMAVHQQISGEQFLKSLDGLQIPSRAENLKMLGGETPALAKSGHSLMQLMLKQRLLEAAVDVAAIIASGPVENVPP